MGEETYRETGRGVRDYDRGTLYTNFPLCSVPSTPLIGLDSCHFIRYLSFVPFAVETDPLLLSHRTMRGCYKTQRYRRGSEWRSSFDSERNEFSERLDYSSKANSPLVLLLRLKMRRRTRRGRERNGRRDERRERR